MTRLTAVLIIVGVCTVYRPDAAQAANRFKICLNTNTGQMIAKRRCKAKKGEVALDASALTAMAEGTAGPQGPTGPQGPQGPQGPAGGFDIARCFKREVSATGSGVVSATSVCLVSEYLTATGCSITGAGTIIGERLSVGENTLLGDQAYGILQCTGWDPLLTGASYTVTAHAQCCRA